MSNWCFWKKETICDPHTGDEYLFRLRIFDTPWLRLYYHQIFRSDMDRDLHDHPWWFVSFILKGGYLEYLPDGVVRWIGKNKFVFHKAEDLHRLELIGNMKAHTLVLAGPKTRQWGFMTKKGWVHNQEYEH